MEAQTQQQKEIENWRQAEATLKRIPRVNAVAPTITAEAAVIRGGKRVGVQIYGAEPEQINAVTPMTKYLVSGHFLGLRPDEVLITYKVAQDLRRRARRSGAPGDREGITDAFTVGGVFDTGQEMNVAYIRLRPAQSLSIRRGADDSGAHGRPVRRRPCGGSGGRPAALRGEILVATVPSVRLLARPALQHLAFLISGFALVTAAFAIASVLIVSIRSTRSTDQKREASLRQTGKQLRTFTAITLSKEIDTRNR